MDAVGPAGRDLAESLRPADAARTARWGQVPAGGLPAAVADMDLGPPDVAVVAAREAVAGSLGYPAQDLRDGLRAAADEWWTRRHGLALPAERTAVTTSVVNAFASVLGRMTTAGDVAVRLVPGYPPIAAAIAAAGLQERRVAYRRGPDARWQVDQDELHAALEGARVLMHVNPANPTGTVWTHDEQVALAEVAAAHGVLVVSDEVWGDVVHAPHEHVPFAPIAAEVAPDLRVVTLVGTGKTFDLAGISSALVVSSHADAHLRVAGPGDTAVLALPSVPAIAAGIAAFRHGADWFAATSAVLRRNRDVATAALRGDLGAESVAEQQGTYVLWVRAPERWGDAPAAHLLEQAGLVVTDGAAHDGPGFVRLNLALQPDGLDELVRRLRSV